MTAGPGRPRSAPRPASHRQIEKVPCPGCGAQPGEHCRTPRGGWVQVPHGARRAAAAEAGVYTP